ncbi:hypothetical protein [Alkalicoccobacillus plakortidis]|uniref:Transposase n=1 Tax=Alkalicoccobacillus plakortidis TaxID=444060 RepID=A0ABT0XGW9_9BACI|nr:hypothetical protein [Alkalicoccobacillus plakortidis]MCM2674459.1 hypothetical protein [Alkalicoccobacillus plakortidis]
MIQFNGTPQLETERLLLRKFTMDDVFDAFNHWLSDERVSDQRISPSSC